MKLRNRPDRNTPAAQNAVRLFTAGTVAWLCLSGCATSIESPVGRPRPLSAPCPLRVAVLPPRINDDLLPDNIQPGKPFIQQLLDGRGTVITSANASRDIGMGLISTLAQAGLFERIFLVTDRAEAEQLGADALLAVSVHDYRAVQMGTNRTGWLMTLTSPLMSQYWMRWRTIEARFDWDVHLVSMADGSTLFERRIQRAYTAPVRSASGEHFSNKMLSFLQGRTAPDYIGELFELNMRPLPPVR